MLESSVSTQKKEKLRGEIEWYVWRVAVWNSVVWDIEEKTWGGEEIGPCRYLGAHVPHTEK